MGDPPQCTEFVRKSWIRDWIEDAYVEKRGAVAKRGDEANQGEPWAMYVALMNGIAKGCNIPAVDFADTFSKREFGNSLHVEVDLVLDIGNSRTCGILVEEGPNDSEIGLGSPPVPLEIRDLGRPERVLSLIHI